MGTERMASPPSCLHLELDHYHADDPEVFRDLVHYSLTSLVSALGSGYVEAIAQAEPLTSRSLARHYGSFGSTGTVFGLVMMGPADRKRQPMVYAWSERAFDRLLVRAGEFPEDATVRFGVLGETGQFAANILDITVTRGAAPDGMAQVSAHWVPGTLPSDSIDWDSLSDRWSQSFSQLASEAPFSVRYGYLGHESMLLWMTPLEMALGPVEWESGDPEYLRGYSWCTVVTADMLQRLGGHKRLEDLRPFARVEKLPDGAFLAWATNSLSDYDDAAVRRIFDYFRPALPPGIPQPPMRYGRAALVYEDASAGS